MGLRVYDDDYYYLLRYFTLYLLYSVYSVSIIFRPQTYIPNRVHDQSFHLGHIRAFPIICPIYIILLALRPSHSQSQGSCLPWVLPSPVTEP